MTVDVKDPDTFGPQTEAAKLLHATKYRSEGETFYDSMVRVAAALSRDDEHRRDLKKALLEQRFLPAGRIQAGAGAIRRVTLANCFVAPVLEDSTESIFDVLTKGFQTMRRGGGVGFDFSNLRPVGSIIKSLSSPSSGPLSFMNIYDAMCKTVSSAGHRRGAMMGTMLISHPDIEAFIDAKHDNTTLTGFNVSVLVTDAYMHAVRFKTDFDLKFEGVVVKTVFAPALWDKLMRSTYDYAEPGVIFIDVVNEFNNLREKEHIQCTNPCAEQPLPPNGACVLGSLNLVKYWNGVVFDYLQLILDTETAIKALDKVHDQGSMPIAEQEAESQAKRRIGLGVTGYGSRLTLMGIAYGSPAALDRLDIILRTIRDAAYQTSVLLAAEHGPFPMYDEDSYLDSPFVQNMPDSIIAGITKYGIRNSHLTSIAPTGTISMCADNVSGGIEPVFANSTERDIIFPDGVRTVEVKDYAYEMDKKTTLATAENLTPKAHLDTLIAAQEYIDSAISKTINVGDNVEWEEFKKIYMDAYEGGAKGCTTFRIAGKRFALLKSKDDEACTYDPETGVKTCDS